METKKYLQWCQNKEWIVYHGCSINIDNDLNLYKKIIPCGLNNEKCYFFIRIRYQKVKILNKKKTIFLKNYLKYEFSFFLNSLSNLA